MEPNSTDDINPKTAIILLYFAAYITSAVIFQQRSDILPSTDGSPIEYFTGALLWMSSLICLLIADLLRTESWKSWLWLIVSAGLALLALDEIFSFHEQTGRYVGDDDHIKVLQWFFTGGVVYLINRFEHSSPRSKIAFVTGYIFHGFYLISDIGDGDYFTIPYLSISQLQWTEEHLELLALTAYCIAFIFLYTNILKVKRLPDQ